MSTGKIIIVAAPSGCGKSTIIAGLPVDDLNLRFAISATTRPPRGSEQNGVEYYFMTVDEFRDAIAENAFIEYEEVYPGRFYGTLRSEIDRISSEGHNVLLDLDVNGALRVKEMYGDRCLTVFIEPPSIETLRRRLEKRGTESPEAIDARVDRAAYELSRAPLFDRRIVNDDLDTAIRQATNLAYGFLTL